MGYKLPILRTGARGHRIRYRQRMNGGRGLAMLFAISYYGFFGLGFLLALASVILFFTLIFW